MKILKTNEAGRSMVEMLGVLAIIGVLSVAGISGYTVAMRSHRTNEIINAASMLYIAAMSKNTGDGADTNYTEIGTTIPGGAGSMRYSNTSGTITIGIKNQEDCLMIKNKLGNKAGECVTSGTSYALTVTMKEATTPEPEPIPSESGECPDGWKKLTIDSDLVSEEHLSKYGLIRIDEDYGGVKCTKASAQEVKEICVEIFEDEEGTEFYEQGNTYLCVWT